MKKTLALVLAALMTAGMTTVAFAAGPLDVNLMDDEGSGVASLIRTMTTISKLPR